MSDTADSQPAAKTTDPVTTTPTSEVTENTEAAGNGHMIPKSRLDEVIGQRNDARAEITAMTERLAALEAKATEAQAAPVAAAADEPPEGLTSREQIRWYVENDAKSLMEKELGMSLDKARALLGTTTTTAKAHAESVWNASCAASGLDPANAEVQELVAGLVKGAGVDFEDAIGRVAKLYSVTPRTETATPEVPGQTGAMAASSSLPSNTLEAMEMARKGVRAPMASSQDIIRRSIEAARK
jgi:hypothetical protein